MTHEDKTRRIDQNGLKSGQALTIILLIVAFVLNIWILVALVGIAQLLGALAVPYAPYKVVYDHVVKPSGLIQPNTQPDNPEPHRFAMLLGAIFNFLGTTLILAGAPTIGWILVWIVIALANLNFWLNFCAGCWMYYQFNRLGVPGFTRSPIYD